MGGRRSLRSRGVRLGEADTVVDVGVRGLRGREIEVERAARRLRVWLREGMRRCARDV